MIAIQYPYPNCELENNGIGINPCPTDNCVGLGVNPNCIDQRLWGCRICANNYWKENNDYPCISCNLIPNCIECVDFHGCNTCASGYTLRWTNNCQFPLRICV